MFKNKKRLLCFLIAAVLVLTGILGFLYETSKKKSISPSAAAINSTETENTVPIEEQQVNYDSFDKLDEFAEEVTDAIADDKLDKDGEFDLKRLLVLSDTDAFDVQGATDVMSFDNLYILSYDSVKATKAAYKALSKDENILSVEADKPAEIAAAVTGNETKAVSDYGKQKSNVTVAVLDTGYDTSYYNGDRILESTYNVSGSGAENSVQDDNGHGTVMANIILDQSKANVLPLKIADNEGRTSGLRMYIGMKQAIASKADVINISMAAYKSNSSELMDSVITEAKDAGILTVVSAGNYGEDAANYSPANAKDAITVAAVKNDKTLDKTSNYGDVVDYVAYGSLEVGGMNGEISVSDGTSVSAAIVSGVAADVIADGNQGYAEVIKALDALAEDLGDTKYGRGFLGNIDVKAEGSTEEGKKDDVTVVKSELLTCDWKSLSDEELNALIEGATEIDAKRFLDDLSEEDKEKVLSIKDCYYNRETTSLVGEVNTETGTVEENKRFHGTYLEYLYSDYFKDYAVQYDFTKDHNGRLYFNTVGGVGYVKLKTSENSTKATIKIQATKEPSDSSAEVKVTATNGGAYDFKNMKWDKFVGTSGCGIKDIKVSKTHHAKVTGISADKPPCSTVENKWETSDFFYGYDGTACADSFTTCFMFSDADEECSTHNEDGKTTDAHRTYSFNISGYGKKNGESTSTTTPSTCYSKGSTVTQTEQLCNHCNGVTGYASSTTELAYAAHNYANQPWVDDQNGYSHHQDCVNYARCSQVAANNAASRVTHEHDNFIDTVETPANCTTKGSVKHTCGTCGYYYYTYPDPLGHDWYWHTETNNGISNGHLWVQCDRPGCDKYNIKRDNEENKWGGAVDTDRYRLVLEKDQHTQSVSQTATETLASLGTLGNTSAISGLNIGEYHAVGATATTTATPNIGYHFDSWNMSDTDAHGISWDPNANPTSFAMPGRAITVKANSAINTSTLVVVPGFVSSYKPECSGYWEGSSEPQSFGPKPWHTKKNISLPTRVGYDFTTWTLTSDHPNDGPGTMSTLTGPAVFTYGSDRAATSTDTLTANWTPRSDTKYVVRHWQQNLGYGLGDDQEKYDVLMDDYENYYKLVETENLQGESDKVLVFTNLAKNYKGFHFITGTTNVNDGAFVQSAQAVIYPDGVTEINLFYARNRYTVNISHDGSGEVYTDSEGRNDKRNESNWFQYGDDVTVSYESGDGWYTKYITVDGVKIEKTNLLPYRDAYKFPDLDRNHTVDVTFKIMPHINIISKFDGKNGDLDKIKQWKPTFIYHVEGMDYLGRHVGYNFITNEWDKILDTRILPGEYTVTSKPVNRWKIRDASVDQFQVGEMSKDFAITVNLIDREDPADGMKAPTSLFTYVYGVDYWNGYSSSDIVVNKLRK